jgi:NYN domain
LQAYEEKETDVNIGIRIVRDAFRDVFDVYYLVSADTDLAPAIRTLKQVVFSKGIRECDHAPHSSEFLRLADRTLKITNNALSKCLLPANLMSKEGKTVMRPAQYDPPKGGAE